MSGAARWLYYTAGDVVFAAWEILKIGTFLALAFALAFVPVILVAAAIMALVEALR